MYHEVTLTEAALWSVLRNHIVKVHYHIYCAPHGLPLVVLLISKTRLMPVILPIWGFTYFRYTQQRFVSSGGGLNGILCIYVRINIAEIFKLLSDHWHQIVMVPLSIQPCCSFSAFRAIAAWFRSHCLLSLSITLLYGQALLQLGHS